MTPAIDGDLLDALEALFSETAVGSDNPVSSGEIADRLGINDSSGHAKTREAIRVLVEEREVPVAAGPKGYYRIDEPQEFYEYQQSLQQRIDGIEERRQLVADAWGGLGGGTA